MIYENAKRVLSGRRELPIDFHQIKGIGGEAIVAPVKNEDKVIKILEIPERKEVLDKNQKKKLLNKDAGRVKKNEISSKDITSDYVLKPSRFIVQIIRNRIFYVYGKIIFRLRLNNKLKKIKVK